MDVNAKRDNSRIKEIEIMDSTLRDGEQTNGVSFLPHEKLMIARMLLHDINVDRIEVASARVSEGERMLSLVFAVMPRPLVSWIPLRYWDSWITTKAWTGLLNAAVMSSTSWRRVATSTAPSSSRCRLRSISLISSRLSTMP